MVIEEQPLALAGLLKSVNMLYNQICNTKSISTKVCSNMSAGSVISYISERGLIKKLDVVALLITDPPPTNSTTFSIFFV